MLLEPTFLHSVRLSGESLDAVAVDGLLKMAAARGKAGLERGRGWSGRKKIIDLEWEQHEMPSIAKQPLDGLAALKALGRTQRKFFVGDRHGKWPDQIPGGGLFQLGFVGDGQFVTSLAATAGQYLTSVGGLHALAEAMYGLATTTMGLKCTFHCKNVFYSQPTHEIIGHY
jgi:hypothetical protein